MHTKNNKNNVKKEAIAEAVDQVIENAELTDKQRLFVFCMSSVLMLQRRIRKHMK